MAAPTRSPCLAEIWFVEDGLRAIDGLCPACRTGMLRMLAAFAATPREALSEVYRLSRAIRVRHLFAGRPERAAAADDWEALRVMWSIGALVQMGVENWRR